MLIVAECLQTNGAMMSLVGLLNALSQKDYEISLFCFNHTGELMTQVPRHVNVLPEISAYRVFSQFKNIAIKWAVQHLRLDLALFRACVWLERGLKLRPRLWRLLPRVEGDWDVVCGYADGLLSEIVISKFKGARKALWVHENYEDTKPSVNIRVAFEKADGIVCVSQDAMEHFEKWFGKSVGDKARVIHNVTDPERCRKLADKSESLNNDDVPTIVSVGRLSHEKGYDLVPKIACILKERGVNFKWQVIGGGLPEIAAEMKMVDSVEVLGPQFNPYLYIKNAKLLVSLSRAEGWGMNVSEALALHKPVICSDIAVYREQVRDGENGFCVERTPKAFADAIEKLLTDEELYAKMCVAADCEICSPEAVRREFSQLMAMI